MEDSNENESAVGDVASKPEEADIPSKRRLRRGIYLLPNLITTGALFSGFYSIIASMNGALEKAAIAICVAAVLDAMDGRIARLTNTQTEFGVQYDSLSDLVAFGVAPAVLLFSWGLNLLYNLGWMMAFIYMACAALRLARFNTHPDSGRSFTGLASPAAAGCMATLVWLWADLFGDKGFPGLEVAFVVGLFATVVALLMVSNITYYSPKGIHFKGRVPSIYLLPVIMLFVVIFLYPPGVLLVMGLAYAFSGPVSSIWRKRKARVNTSAE